MFIKRSLFNYFFGGCLVKVDAVELSGSFTLVLFMMVSIEDLNTQ